MVSYILGQNPTYDQEEPLTETHTPSDDGFYALLQTPNVVGTVYMLIRARDGLGRKTIKSVSFHRPHPDDAQYVWIELEDARPFEEGGAGRETLSA